MRGAPNWKQFMQSFNRNFYPDRGEQVDLFDEIDDEAGN
jgi:hypothetical protein